MPTDTATTIQQAIDKLEALKAESMPGPWLIHRASTGIRGSQSYAWVVVDDTAGRFPLVEKANFGNDGDLKLIVTLHRTIDAQLAILRFGLKRQEAIDWTRRLAVDKHREAASLELDLATAILGVSPEETD